MTLPTPMRFAVEALFLVALGVALAAANLGLLPFVLVMAGAWVLVAWGERVLLRPAVARPAEGRRAPAAAKESIRVDQAPVTAPDPAWPEREPDSATSPVDSEPDVEPDAEPERALEAVPDPDPEPEPEVEQHEPEEPLVVELPQAASRRPDGWNLWDLEHRAQERAGEDPIRDEEWNALLISLRDYARPDGTLPPEFDALVNESFGELITRRA